VYAKQNLFPGHPRGLAVFCRLPGLVLLFVSLFISAPLRADPLEDAAHKLAVKVCLDPHKSPFRIQWLESAGTSSYLTDSRKKIFLDQLSACGISLTENADAPALKVNISVTATNVLLTADAANVEGGRQIRMVEIPRSSLFNQGDVASAPHLMSEILWGQEKPIQSAMEWVDSATQERFLLLAGDGVFVRRRFASGSWELLDTTELPASSRRFRNGEGTFLYGASDTKPHLLVRGKLCDFNTAGRVTFNCSENRASSGDAMLLSNCEDLPRKLISGSGDYTQSDRILLARKDGKEEGAAPEEKYGASVEVPGPVLDISVAPNQKAAFASVRNLSTGNYEVYRITSVCSD
jgi:hypothetical protein